MPSAAGEPVRWIEVAVESGPEAVEAVSEILGRVGHDGIAVDLPLEADRPHVVKAYVVNDHSARIKVRRVKEAIGRLRAFGLGPVGEVTLRRVRDEDWLEAWKAQFTPNRVGPFLIRPTWSEPGAGGIEIVLDPGMAFGTGLHPTTRQCLEAVGELDLKGRTVLDVGTGSGILAIGAAKRGAGRVVAVDTDPLAVRSARENAQRNAVAVEVVEGSAGDVAGAFDVVLANLVADVIVRIADDLVARVERGGTLVCAGIVRDKAPAVTDALAGRGFRVISRVEDDDWVRLCLA